MSKPKEIILKTIPFYLGGDEISIGVEVPKEGDIIVVSANVSDSNGISENNVIPTSKELFTGSLTESIKQQLKNARKNEKT